MYESRIATGRLTVSAVEGFPPDIDALAARNLAGHGFLRAAWFAAPAPTGGRTLLLRRDGDEGALAAIPTIAFGPAIARARKVPGSYWPLRAALIAPDCDVFELAHALDHRAARCLGPVWRVGPTRADDPATTMLVAAAQLANWTVLARPAGTSWVIDLDAARDRGWPHASSARKLRAAWRKLEDFGSPHWRYVRGADWDSAALEDMGRIEAESWIARTTDGSGAKFMTPAQRALWSHVLSDPVLAEKLSATILMLGDRPIAFSFDLDDGPVQYGIAGSYAEDLKRFYIGKLANVRAIEDAIAAGQSVTDLGAGDNGYKRDMGAVRGYDMTDLLFVRSRTAARVLARVWGEALPPSPPSAAIIPGAAANG
ncbi:MAG: GNAT family N-acetyltransferase [Porphyrobacter sp. IPPAS B-1204]|nr:MAG: GNAT family N-acetyltransferase [Porphyrobacter sp. IPPAS B-1204]